MVVVLDPVFGVKQDDGVRQTNFATKRGPEKPRISINMTKNVNRARKAKTETLMNTSQYDWLCSSGINSTYSLCLGQIPIGTSSTANASSK
jgi:hypothetical protein